MNPETDDGETDILARYQKPLPPRLDLYHLEPFEVTTGDASRVWDRAGREYRDIGERHRCTRRLSG